MDARTTEKLMKLVLKWRTESEAKMARSKLLTLPDEVGEGFACTLADKFDLFGQATAQLECGTELMNLINAQNRSK